MDLSGKKILFLSASFFGYEKAITARLQELGAEVDFFNERPADTVLSKGLIRLKSRLYQKRTANYYRKLLRKTEKKKYDFFLLIKGESIPFFFLKSFREANPACQMVFYAYDAAAEYPKFLQLYPFFDKNFTFEPADAIKHQLHFRPLFFLKEYAREQKNEAEKYELVFIGTAHTDRYLIGEKVRQSCDRKGLRTFFYYYAPGKTAFMLKKIFDKNLQQFDRKKLSFDKLSHAEIADIYRSAKAVLDINKPFQKGLTMRTFEVLAAGKKLVTTNEDIKNYPFFSEYNVLVIDRAEPSLPEIFFESPAEVIKPEILEKMSLDSWLHCLLVETQDDFWEINRWENLH